LEHHEEDYEHGHHLLQTTLKNVCAAIYEVHTAMGKNVGN